MSIREKLANRAKKAGITLETGLFAALETYFSLLRKWNLKVSLTSLDVESPSDEAVDRLLIEPLLAARQFPKDAQLWVDIGSGGGSPAIPLKLVRPAAKLHMVESRTRKAAFLREVVRQLRLENARVENIRAEELGSRSGFASAVSVLTIRAVKVDEALLRNIDVLLRPEGVALMFQSQEGTPETLAPMMAGQTIPLIPSLGSRLLVLSKARFD